MRRTPQQAVWLFVAWTVLWAPTAGRTEETGVSDGRILFGQSAAFSGPAGQLGTDMRRGIEAAFQEANRRGGVHGRRVGTRVS